MILTAMVSSQTLTFPRLVIQFFELKEGYKDYVVGGKIPEFTWLWLGILSSVSISILLTYNARLSKIVLVILILMVILCCGLFEYFVIHYDFD